MPRIAILLACLLCSSTALAELMTVQNLKDMIQKGPVGELAATSYVQGAIEGLLGMDSLHHKEKRLPYEFCRFHDSYAKGKPEQHPAVETKAIVAAWEKQGGPMNTPAVDMLLAYMTAQFGCNN